MIFLSYRFANETDRLMISNIESGDEGAYACVVIEGGVGPRIVTAGCIVIHGELQHLPCSYHVKMLRNSPRNKCSSSL